MLAQAKQGLKFRNERNDTWVLVPSQEVTANSTLSKDATAATTYLERVVSEHADTPWAMDAKRELAQPLGWKWRERFTNVAARVARAQQMAQGRVRRRADPPAMPQKPRRDPPAL
jgi:hypothetical protein